MKYVFVFSMLAFICSCTASTRDVRTNGNASILSTPLSSPLPSIDPKPISSIPEKKNFAFATSIGNVELGNGCVWFRIQNPDLSPGDEVQVVFAEELSKQVAFIARIAKDTVCEDHDKTPWPSLQGHDETKDMSKYRLDIDNNDYPRGYGFGVVNSTNEIVVSSGLASGDLNGDGKSEFFRECTSNEGMHMTVWTGEPITGRRIWHSYYHFPYDTEFTCTKKDYQ